MMESCQIHQRLAMKRIVGVISGTIQVFLVVRNSAVYYFRTTME